MDFWMDCPENKAKMLILVEKNSNVGFGSLII